MRFILTLSLVIFITATGAADPINFRVAPEAATGLAPQRIAVGDLNGDGYSDVVTADHDRGEMGRPGYVSILINHGDGTFAAPVRYLVGGSPRGVTLGDLNGDGSVDIVVANYWDHNISVLINHGDGTFQPRRNYPAAWYSHDVALADFNGDGALDIAVSGEVDNNDGNLDVVGAVGVRSRVYVALGDGAGRLTDSGRAFTVGYGPARVAAVDLNGDGLPELITSNGTGNSMTVLINETSPADQPR